MKAGLISYRKLIKYWLPVIIWMGFIYWMSTGTFSSENTQSLVETVLRLLVSEISPHEVGLFNASIRKAGHVIEYFILGFLLFRAFRGASTASWNWRWALLTITVVFLWAASDEFHQSFVTTRTASIADTGIDTAGGVLSQILSAFWYREKKR
jgi:VanZ family protein